MLLTATKCIKAGRHGATNRCNTLLQQIALLCVQTGGKFIVADQKIMSRRKHNVFALKTKAESEEEAVFCLTNICFVFK